MSEQINKQMLEALTILIEAKELKGIEGNKSINYLAKKAEGWAKARHAVKQANDPTTNSETALNIDFVTPRTLFNNGVKYAEELAIEGNQELNKETCGIIAKEYSRHVYHYLKTNVG